MKLDEFYWDRYWKSLNITEREKLADLLLDRDSGEIDWIVKNNFSEFPKYIQETLVPEKQLEKAVRDRIEACKNYSEEMRKAVMIRSLEEDETIKLNEARIIETELKFQLQQILGDKT